MTDTLGRQDAYNRILEANVRPPAWENPRPQGRYNLVVVGAGTAGLVAAAGGAGLGARVALVEERLMGGDCLNFGCVPSKALLRCARAAADAQRADAFGIYPGNGGEVRADFPQIMERMRNLRARLSRNDSADRFRGLGVDVYLGRARFTSPASIEVEGQTLEFRKAIIATGTHPTVPAIPGLQEAGFLTNETVFSLLELPARLVILGGGPIGCELAQAFARFGSRVTIVGRASMLLPREDPEASQLVADTLVKEGVELLLGATIERVETTENGKRVFTKNGGATRELLADAILVAAGRTPNVEGLGLEAAGVAFDNQGVQADDRLRTANPRIYAAGDVCLSTKYTHAADATARIAIQNALFPLKRRLSGLTIPRCTYTDPEVAHIGLTGRDLSQKGTPFETVRIALKEVDRAVLEGEEEGFLKVHVLPGSGEILGASIVARHAGEMMGALVVAMARGLTLKAASQLIIPYPTEIEALRKAGDSFMRGRLTPRLRSILRRYMAWLR